jgi:muramoyltetrapeptide carboxypeptidase
MQMLEHLPFEKMRERPIPFLGSSDASSILCALAAKSSAVSFHGPMVAQQLARGFFDSDGMCALLCDSGPLGFQDAPSVTPLHPGAAEGHLLGGCLSIVTALCGTEFLPSFSGAILFLEDTGTKPYQIDRMLTQLQLSGALDGVRGLVFGEMPKCDQHPEQGYRLEDMLRDWTAWMKVPVLFGFPSGHTLSPARTLPFGIRARVDKEGLHLLEGAVL